MNDFRTWLLQPVMDKLNEIQREVLMADQALTDLQQAAQTLEVSVKLAVDLIKQMRGAPGTVADSDVEAVVTQLDNSVAELNAAVNPSPSTSPPPSSSTPSSSGSSTTGS